MAQRSSRTAVERLNGINRTVIVLVMAAIVVAALLLPGIVGGALLLVVGVGLALMLRATWHRHDLQRRAARLAILALVVVIAVVKLTG
jgi:uncharacterized membrane protein